MFEFEGALSLNGGADRGNKYFAIVQGNVPFQPGLVRLIGVGKVLSAHKLAHLIPIRAHAVHNIRTCFYQSPKARFTLVALQFGAQALDRRSRSFGDFADQFDLSRGPLTRYVGLDGESSYNLAAIEERDADVRSNLKFG
jgi:hypothetical protein